MIYGIDFDEYCGEWDEDEDDVGQYWDRKYEEMRDRALDGLDSSCFSDAPRTPTGESK